MFQLEMLRRLSTHRSSFEANQGLTYQEATSSINHKKEGLGDVANNEKRGLTTGGLIEVINGFTCSECWFFEADKSLTHQEAAS